MLRHSKTNGRKEIKEIKGSLGRSSDSEKILEKQKIKSSQRKRKRNKTKRRARKKKRRMRRKKGKAKSAKRKPAEKKLTDRTVEMSERKSRNPREEYSCKDLKRNIERKKLKGNNDHDCACGLYNGMEISGGEEAVPHNYPWVVRIVGGCAEGIRKTSELQEPGKHF